jgi:hypothetical protein
MAENVDRFRNELNLEYTFSQRLGNKWAKWQIFLPHEDTRATCWMGDNPF